MQHITPLTPSHDADNFRCGEVWLERYLSRHALGNQQAGYGRTYVLADASAAHIVRGYYTISMGSVVFTHLPPALAQRMPRYPMPVAHIGCLAVSQQEQGRGLGTLLLIDALRKIVTAADVIAARAVDVKAISDRARQWYESLGFQPFLDEPTHMYFPMTTARDLIARLP